MNIPNFEDYSFEIRPLSEEDGGGFLITFPDLPGCMSDGETPEEAIHQPPGIEVPRGYPPEHPQPFAPFDLDAR